MAGPASPAHQAGRASSCVPPGRPGLFVLLTLFAMQSRVEWSFLGAGLYGSLYLLIVAGLLGLLLRSDLLMTLYALAGSLIFCSCVRGPARNIADETERMLPSASLSANWVG